MRAILYLKQILLTYPHLKYFPSCARRMEQQLQGFGPRLG